jgi:hypothetical protein
MAIGGYVLSCKKGIFFCQQKIMEKGEENSNHKLFICGMGIKCILYWMRKFIALVFARNKIFT